MNDGEKEKPEKKSEKTKKGDFIELEYTGYANGEMFDSSVEENIKKLNQKAEVKKTIAPIGHGMFVQGLDEALVDKEIGKDYDISFDYKKGFGERKRELVKTIPLKSFTDKQVNPRAGMVLNIDDSLAKIITVSGARVVTDFNNPLSGKDIKYEFKIKRIVEDVREKAESLFENLFRFVPKFDVKDKVIVKGDKMLGPFVEAFKDKFKELVGLDLGFEEEKVAEKTEKKEESKKIE